MRRDFERNMNNVEESENVEEVKGPIEEIVHTPMGTTVKSVAPEVKIGAHVKYKDKEYLVQNIRDNGEIFICMGNESHVVKKSDIETIE